MQLVVQHSKQEVQIYLVLRSKIIILSIRSTSIPCKKLQIQLRVHRSWRIWLLTRWKIKENCQASTLVQATHLPSCSIPLSDDCVSHVRSFLQGSQWHPSQSTNNLYTLVEDTTIQVKRMCSESMRMSNLLQGSTRPNDPLNFDILWTVYFKCATEIIKLIISTKNCLARNIINKANCR